MTEDRTLRRRSAAYVQAVSDALIHHETEEREQILQDLEAHIEDALRARGTAPTMADLEAVLADLGAPADWAAEQPAGPAPAGPPRTSRKALLSLVWSAAFLVIALPMMFIVRVEEAGVESGPGFADLLLRAVGWAALAGGLGGPVLGSMALTAIRHSRGALTGVAMAVIGTAIPPLVVLDLLLLGIASFLFEPGLMEALSLLGVLVLDVVIVVLAVQRVKRSISAAGIRPAAA
jgi:hypothetical protein